MQNKTCKGIIHVTRSGVAFVPHEDFEEDIFIDRGKLGTALNGDTVQVEITKQKKGERAEGRITDVLERCTTEFVGTIGKKKDKLQFIPDDKRFYPQVRLPHDKALAGKKILLRIKHWESAKTDPEAEVIEILGKAGEHETEMQAALVTHGFASGFPKEVLKEADAIKQKPAITDADIKARRDFRDVTTFTIDPADAKDFDDALSYRELEAGAIEVGIHIADVSHYVHPNTTLDKEARKRATSVYLVDRTIPMLPEVLSNDICSLNPNEDRLAFSAVFTFDKNKNVIDRWFGRTIIHSDRRFTYKEAQDAIDTKSGDFADELTTLNSYAKHLHKEREKKGAISFETDEVQFELDKNGKPLRVYVKERLETMKLIEELMLLANREVATWMTEHCKDKQAHQQTFIYRIHDQPDPDKIEELRIFLRAIGYDLGKEGEQLESKDIDNLLREVRGTPEETMIQMATLRSMAKATYTHKNIGHFSLSFQHYTHFTSPIRRYPDIMVHRILASHLEGAPISNEELQAYQKAAITSSEREIAAVRAERDSIKYKQVEFMLGKEGREFEGVVTGVIEQGLFVAEKESRAEGLVHVSTLDDDYYQYNEKKYALVGKKGKKFQLGDTIKIKLKSADLDQRQIDWELVS